MSRTILHSDMNCFYASVEMLHHPELAGKPMAVGGDPEARHGIVLTANYIAKRAGVKTGMALWQARQVCPEIIFVPPRMDLYLRFSRMAQEIYSEYTDQREPFGIDESWLDVTASTSVKGDGMKIAKEISSRIKYELGVTVSIGVSWNKIFAKLGSDYKKPDAITEFSKDNYKDIAWKLPVGDLLMVGRSTERTMKKLGICTIGDLAGAESSILETYLGKRPDATHEEVVEAAKKACCDDFIEALPDGYNTVLDEGGSSLSGGEKQRLSIARAMLKNAPIIILDEATANVDPENEDRLQAAIEALTHDKTIIMIAHRLKTVRNADQILVLDKGEIIQKGTHDQLIASRGIYADFVSGRKQAEGWKLSDNVKI